MEKPRNVKCFRGFINESPVQIGLFPFAIPTKKLYLVQIEELDDENSKVTVVCEYTGSQATGIVPTPYLDGLFVPFDTEAAKILFGAKDIRFD